MGRAQPDLIGAADLDQLARVHDHDAVGDLEQQREVMRDEQDREPQPVLELEDLLQDLALDDDVEPGRRLVHDHDLRLDGERHRDHHPLAHAARELVRVAAQPRARNPDEVDQRLDPIMALVV